jgi:hypothetical protein
MFARRVARRTARRTARRQDRFHETDQHETGPTAELKELKERGLLSDADFEAKKQQILGI